MCTVNLDLERGICNGALGTVIDFSSGMEGTVGTIRPVVRFSNGVVATIPIKFWQSEEFPTVAIGQCPLSLAWAMTIHKIQGATLSMAEIDVGGGIFECGQTYVALSRVKDLEGLYLSKFDPKKIKSSVRVRNFYRSIPEVEYEVEEETEVKEPAEPASTTGSAVDEELGFEKFAMVPAPGIP
jgi:ATP-dependent DNA helicase PIF1